MQRTVSFALPQGLGSILGQDAHDEDFEVYLAEKGIQDLLVRVTDLLARERPHDPVSAIIGLLRSEYQQGAEPWDADESVFAHQEEESPIRNYRAEQFKSPAPGHRMRRRDLDESMISEPDITVDGLAPRAPLAPENDKGIKAIRRILPCLNAENVALNFNALSIRQSLSDEDRAFLTRTLTKCWLFAHTNAEDLARIVDEMEEQERVQGDSFTADGYFYVLSSGECIVHDHGSTHKLVPGEYFGDDALVGASTSDDKSILVQSDKARFFRIAASRFRSAVAQSVSDRRQRHVQLLSSVPILSDLDQKKLLLLADALLMRSYGPGQTVVVQGDRGSEFFLIDTGRAEVLHDGEKVGDLEAGDYFGENALLESTGKRAATVCVPSDTEKPLAVACIRRQVFVRLLGGDVVDAMRRKNSLCKRTPMRSVAKVLTKS